MENLNDLLTLDNALFASHVLVITLWYKRGIERDKATDKIITGMFQTVADCVKDAIKRKEEVA